jgi:hypothetical protein
MAHGTVAKLQNVNKPAAVSELLAQIAYEVKQPLIAAPANDMRRETGSEPS